MADGFISSWPYLGEDVFLRLAELDDEPVPSEVFADIARVLADRLERKLSGDRDDLAELFAAFRVPIDQIQDEQHSHRALEVLASIELPEFTSEADILVFLEATHDLLADEYNPVWAHAFADLVEAFIGKFHLTYKLRRPFRLLPLISGQVARIYEMIEACPGPHGDHRELWEAFEEAYHQFARHDGDPKTPIHKMTSYLEAVAADQLGFERETLGELLKAYEARRVFPHRGTMTGSLDKLYGFTSNYPGIRHAGRPASKNRDLCQDDVAMLSLLLFVWSGYIHTLPAPPAPA